MVGAVRGNSQNGSSKYLTIGGSEASDAQTPSNNAIQNLNPDFDAVRLQTIMESIQQTVPHDSPLIALAEQGVEGAGNIIAAAPSVENHQGEPFGGNRSNDQGKRARSEAASSASDNRRLADNDVCRQITQNHWQRENDRDRDDLRSVIDNKRHLRARSLSPLWRSPVRATMPSEGCVLCSSPGVRKVVGPNKFKPGPIDKYDNFSNPEEFIQVYHIVIEVVGGDDCLHFIVIE
jgi:hypothetical protein